MLCAFALFCGGKRWGGKIGRTRLLRITKQKACLCAGFITCIRRPLRI